MSFSQNLFCKLFHCHIVLEEQNKAIELTQVGRRWLLISREGGLLFVRKVYEISNLAVASFVQVVSASSSVIEAPALNSSEIFCQ